MLKFLKGIIAVLPPIKKRNWTIEKLSDAHNELSRKLYLVNEENKRLKKNISSFIEDRQKFTIKQLQARVSLGKKLRVCFMVMFDAVFAAQNVYEKMLTDELFDPFIVIIPDTSRGRSHQKFNFDKSYQMLSQKYKKVYKGWDEEKNIFIDCADKVDLICFPNAYQGMTDYVFTPDHYLTKDTLMFYVHYSFPVSNFFRKSFKDQTYSYFWKVFVPTKEHLQEFNQHQLLKGKNVTVTGYPKMDSLAKQTIETRTRKKIIIAPHHTVTDWEHLQISNFLKYANFFLELPKIYPQIDFVFRPHPLLITQLRKKEIWGENKTETYFQEIKSYSNLIFDQEGEYLELFANSDGLIHDCGSFMAEYLFTGKPACYILKNQAAIKKWFLPIGQDCLKYHYQAFSKKDILEFIDKVIISEKDPLKIRRISFVKNRLKVSYPFASNRIIEKVKEGIDKLK